jgi:hypothetical protein
MSYEPDVWEIGQNGVLATCSNAPDSQPESFIEQRTVSENYKERSITKNLNRDATEFHNPAR